jgi:hypothetical protein
MGSNIRRFLDRMRQDKKGGVSMSATRQPLSPNDFLGPDIVFYYSQKQHPILLQYLTDHYKRIDAALQEKGMRFVLFQNQGSRPDSERLSHLSAFVDYRYPGLLGTNTNGIGESLQGLLEGGVSDLLHEGLKAALGIPDNPKPSLVHRIYSMTNSAMNEEFIYSFAFLDTRDRRTIHAQVEQYLHRVRYWHDEVYFQLAEEADEYDADERFERDGSSVSEEVRKAVQSLKETDSEKVLLSSLLYILGNIKEARPDIAAKLEGMLRPAHSLEIPRLSRLVIDNQFRILLPEYGREVEMSPLPKSFYLFMLRHPEGVMFRDLPRYRSELIKIYGRVGNRLDRTAIESSIDDLIDHRSNSVNEKCSRIKEGFLRRVDDGIARNYYITGDRKSPKKVALDRSLLVLPEGF